MIFYCVEDARRGGEAGGLAGGREVGCLSLEEGWWGPGVVGGDGAV